MAIFFLFSIAVSLLPCFCAVADAQPDVDVLNIFAPWGVNNRLRQFNDKEYFENALFNAPPAGSAGSAIAINIRERDQADPGPFQVWYSVNGREAAPREDLDLARNQQVTFEFTKSRFDFYAQLDNLTLCPSAARTCDFDLAAGHTSTPDNNAGNDGFAKTITLLRNSPVTLPYTNSFEGLAANWDERTDVIGVAGELDFDIVQDNGGRARSSGISAFGPRTGARAVYLDRTANTPSNYLTLTLNMENYGSVPPSLQASDPRVFWVFWWAHTGDGDNGGDRAWVRSRSSDAWGSASARAVYNFNTNRPSADTW